MDDAERTRIEMNAFRAGVKAAQQQKQENPIPEPQEESRSKGKLLSPLALLKQQAKDKAEVQEYATSRFRKKYVPVRVSSAFQRFKLRRFIELNQNKQRIRPMPQLRQQSWQSRSPGWESFGITSDIERELSSINRLAVPAVWNSVEAEVRRAASVVSNPNINPSRDVMREADFWAHAVEIPTFQNSMSTKKVRSNIHDEVNRWANLLK